MALPRDAVTIYKSFGFPRISNHCQEEIGSHRPNLKRIETVHQGQSRKVSAFASPRDKPNSILIIFPRI